MFLIVGGFCTVFDLLFLKVFVDFFGLSVILATIISFCLISFFNYVLNTRYIFMSGKYNLQKEIFFFYVFALFSLVLTIGLMHLFTTVFAVHYLVSKFIIIIIVSLVSFIIRKKILFLK